MTRAGWLTGVLMVVALGCGDDGAGEGDGGTAAAATSTSTGPDATTMTTMAPDETTTDAVETTTGAESSDGPGDSTGPGPTDDGGSSSTGAPDDGVITFDEIAPIYQDKCLPCHTTGTFGGHNIGDDDLAAAYEDSQLDANIATCNGLTKGACALVRIQNGSMPMGFGCTGDPAVDDGELCLTAEEQDRIQTWIDDGELGPL